MEKNKLTILAVCGSLRKQSNNRALIEYCIAHAPETMTIEFFDIGLLPLYNQDTEDLGFPESVLDLRLKIREADGIVMACPEYNMSISGVLKNAIDWVSRKDDLGYPFSKKPIMIIGATTGQLGTARAQKELRSVLAGLNTYPMNKPELLVSSAESKISNGLQDEKTKAILDKMLISFSRWINTVQSE